MANEEPYEFKKKREEKKTIYVCCNSCLSKECVHTRCGTVTFMLHFSHRHIPFIEFVPFTEVSNPI